MINSIDPQKIDWKKVNELVPAIIQHAETGKVLMLGYMNPEALEKTLTSGKVCFYSRSKQRLWTKGEGSGNFLIVRHIALDCDQDTLLILADPKGPTCHLGTDSCFGERDSGSFTLEHLSLLERTINQRYQERPEGSYTTKLFAKGRGKIAQKVGEEGVEIVVAALHESDTRLREESADFLYHLLVLLRERGVTLSSVLEVLAAREKRR